MDHSAAQPAPHTALGCLGQGDASRDGEPEQQEKKKNPHTTTQKPKKHTLNPQRVPAARAACGDGGREAEDDALTDGAARRKRRSDHERRPDKS